jgi:hypothetical protein
MTDRKMLEWLTATCEKFGVLEAPVRQVRAHLAATASPTGPAEERCECHLEEGDSECRVHPRCPDCGEEPPHHLWGCEVHAAEAGHLPAREVTLTTDAFTADPEPAIALAQSGGTVIVGAHERPMMVISAPRGEPDLAELPAVKRWLEVHDANQWRFCDLLRRADEAYQPEAGTAADALEAIAEAGRG